MSDATTRTEMQVEADAGSQPNVAETSARAQGWSPKEEWRGPAEEWVDAPTFLAKAKEINPFLRSRNKKLEGELQGTTRKVSVLEEELKSTKEQIEALKEFNAEQVKAAAKQQVELIKKQIRDARSEGNIEREAELMQELGVEMDKVKAPPVEKKPEVKPETRTAAPVAAEIAKAVGEFSDANPWYKENTRYAAVMNDIYREMIQKGETKDLSIRDAMDEAGRRTLDFFGQQTKPATTTSKVLGSKGGESSVATKSFADMPQEAKDSAARWAKRLVGPTKAWKTDEAYFKHFSENYWSQQSLDEAVAPGSQRR